MTNNICTTCGGRIVSGACTSTTLNPDGSVAVNWAGPPVPVLTAGAGIQLDTVTNGDCSLLTTISSTVVDVNVATVTFNPLTGELVLTETDGQIHTVTIDTTLDCEEIQDCVGGMLDNVGFVYDDTLNMWVTNPAATPGQVLTSDGTGNANWVTPTGGCPPTLTDTILYSYSDTGSLPPYTGGSGVCECVWFSNVVPDFVIPNDWCPSTMLHGYASHNWQTTVTVSPPFDGIESTLVVLVYVNGIPTGRVIKNMVHLVDSFGFSKWGEVFHFFVPVNPGDTIGVTFHDGASIVGLVLGDALSWTASGGVGVWI